MADGPDGRTVIRGGTVYDGTGAAGRPADLAVLGDRINAVGAVPPRPGDRVIEAAGLAVAPGFINIHAHSDLSAFAYPGAESRLLDGVTTEVSGNCGHSAFPVLETLSDNLGADASRFGVEVTWADFAGYADRLAASGSAVNHAFFVGHGALRVAAMGHGDRAPTAAEQAEMRRLLALCLEQGAWGLSSGLIYPPGCYATEGELADLAQVCARARPPGLYASHQRNEGDRLEESLAEFLAVARRSGVRAQLSHVKVIDTRNWGKQPWMFDEIERARSAGLAVTGDRYPYTASATGLSRDLPAWVHDGGRAAFVKRLADPAARRRLAQEVRPADPADHWGRIVIAWSKSDAHTPYLGRSVYDLAREAGRDPLEFALDLLLEAEGSVSAIYHRMDEAGLIEVLKRPWIVVGSDSMLRSTGDQGRAGLPHPRGFGTHARILGVYVREKRALTLTEAVHKMTGAVAEIMGLSDRGRLAPGCFADLVIFDPNEIGDRATYEAPLRPSVGVRHVLVNGQPVLLAGAPTGARPGRVLKRV